MTYIVTSAIGAAFPAGCVLLGVVDTSAYWHVGPDADAKALPKGCVTLYTPSNGVPFRWDDFANASGVADQLMPHVFEGGDQAPATDTPFVLAQVALAARQIVASPPITELA